MEIRQSSMGMSDFVFDYEADELSSLKYGIGAELAESVRVNADKDFSFYRKIASCKVKQSARSHGGETQRWLHRNEDLQHIREEGCHLV